MHRLMAGAGLLASLLLAAACGGGGPDPAQVAKGRELFIGTCATCHGRNAEGMPKLGKNLKDNAFTQNLNDAELVEFLKKGRPAWDPLNTQGVDMPPRGGNPALKDEDLAAIAAYLRTL